MGSYLLTLPCSYLKAFLLLFWGERETQHEAKRRKSWYVPIICIWVKLGGKPSPVSGPATVGPAAHAFLSAESRSQSSGEWGRGRCKNEKRKLELLRRGLGSGEKAVPPPPNGGWLFQATCKHLPAGFILIFHCGPHEGGLPA